MEERVVDEVEGAVYVFFDAEEEFEGSAGFVAGEEGDVGELAGFVGYVFTGVAVGYVSMSLTAISRATYYVRFKQVTGIGCPTRYPGCWSRGSCAAAASAVKNAMARRKTKDNLSIIVAVCTRSVGQKLNNCNKVSSPRDRET